MKLKEATETFRIPAKIIARMEKEGRIRLPLDEAGGHALSVLSQLWGRHCFIGESLRGIKVSERTMRLIFPNYEKIDRYILNTFLGEPCMKKVSTEVLRYRVKMAFAADVDVQRIRMNGTQSMASETRRPARGFTVARRSNCGKIFTTINISLERNTPANVLVRFGKAGGCGSARTESPPCFPEP